MRARYLAVVVLAACSSSSGGPALSNATSLDCPSPGLLPFRLQSTGFQSADNASLVEDDTRDKDESSDALGNPGGTSANVYLDLDASPGDGIASYHGRKARTPPSDGLTAQPLPGEYVSLWYYDGTTWDALGRTTTDDDGYYDVAATLAPPPGTPVYAVLEADGTCAKHFDDLLASGTQVVVADIDGTLTTDDGQLLQEIGDPTYVPQMMTDANGMLQAWASKGYDVVYLTARPHLYLAETRQWLEQLAFPAGPVITSATLLSADAATEAYKATWLARMVTNFGWSVVAAYGNAVTDIEAYQSVGIPNDRIFIIGPEGGQMGTVAIAGDDYTSHVADFVDVQPDQ
ncbi:MAG TPA: hypothetical protein VGG39_13885 [Polyangiaceae bacterium]|jgi:hypothetical protein